ncbi:hypothetical protein C8R44DRAFT_718714 [Mycena epipterygia]|nr:hypothetical protein C8R44DRAFT_718714 [Mycena epipterygia]
MSPHPKFAPESNPFPFSSAGVPDEPTNFLYDGPSDRLRGQITPPIHGGTFIIAEKFNHSHGEAGIILLHHSVALEALYDSADSFPQPRCYPETRTKMLDDLYRWATALEPSLSIRWLHGPAGAGKSAIMYTLCQRLQDAGLLGGSFFFKRGDATRGNAKVLFATLAYQIALHDSDLRPLISQSVEKNSSVVGRHMEAQLRKLIVEPCQLLPDAPNLILLIDGLDECENDSAQLEILRLLRNTARDHPRRFRILIASRPEPHIRETFQSFNGLVDFVNVEQSFEDIRRYLCGKFARIRREHSETMGEIPTPWPSPAIIDSLVEKSSGYFIYAATVIKFVDDKYFCPAEQLELVQTRTSNDSDSPFEALDQLYIQILSTGPARSRSRLCVILCAMVNFEELPLGHIAQLLGLKTDDVRLTLRSLHSVLQVPQDGYHRIYPHHASFFDFLQDQRRCLEFYVGPGSEHCIKLAYSVLKAISWVNDNRLPAGDRVAWLLKHSWITWITSIPPSAELVPHIHVNLDLLWYNSTGETVVGDAERLLIWLKKIQPLPEDLIRCWEDYRFMGCYEQIHRDLCHTLARGTNCKGLKPSPQTLHAFHDKSNNSLCLPRLDELLSRSPHIIHIFHAIQILDLNRPSNQKSWMGLWEIRAVLDLSWAEIRAIICSLRSVLGEEHQQIRAILVGLLCSDISSGITSVARGFLRLIPKIGTGDLSCWFWDHFITREWGRHIRSSPHSSELLQELREFVPPFDGATPIFNLCAVEFHDVLEWLKAFPDPPPLDLINRWKGYLRKSKDMDGHCHQTEDQLEARWQVRPKQIDEEQMKRWEHALNLQLHTDIKMSEEQE